MDRLTYQKATSAWYRGGHPTKYTSRRTFQQVVDRLAAYEDTGLTPEQVAALAQAETEANEPVTPERMEELPWAEGEDNGVWITLRHDAKTDPPPIGQTVLVQFECSQPLRGQLTLGKGWVCIEGERSRSEAELGMGSAVCWYSIQDFKEENR